jgi:hypothetical protein
LIAVSAPHKFFISNSLLQTHVGANGAEAIQQADSGANLNVNDGNDAALPALAACLTSGPLVQKLLIKLVSIVD